MRLLQCSDTWIENLVSYITDKTDYGRAVLLRIEMGVT